MPNSQLQPVENEGVLDSEMAQPDAVVRDSDTECTESEFAPDGGISGFKFWGPEHCSVLSAGVTQRSD